MPETILSPEAHVGGQADASCLSQAAAQPDGAVVPAQHRTTGRTRRYGLEAPAETLPISVVTCFGYEPLREFPDPRPPAA